MKKILCIVVIVLIFSFQSWTKAEDIKDLQIEGISIGDNLFDHFTQAEFDYAKDVSNIFYYKKNKFAELLFFKHSKFETFDGVKVTWKPDDKNYKLYGVSGLIYFKNNYDECKVKREEIIKDIENFLPNAKNNGNHKINFDKTGNSYALVTDLVLKPPYEEIRIYCSNWSDEEENKGAWDALNVVINHPEFSKFMENPY